MSKTMNRIASDLQKIMSESNKKKTSGFDTQAIVTRLDGEVAWVQFPGGEDETPVKRTTNAVVGDDVRVRVNKGRAWLLGNVTNPPTDDSTASVALDNSDKALENSKIAADSAAIAIDSATIAREKADQAAQDAAIANTAATQAAADAELAQSAAGRAIEDAADAQEAAEDALTAAENASAAASAAQTSANEAKADAARANTAANGAVTSLGIVQGVVDELSDDMDDMQTHVAMMNAIVDPNTGETIIPAGLHVVPTSNGYFIVVSNDGMYVYDDESTLVATFGENIRFDSSRPQKIGGDNAYIEYYDSNNDGIADSIRIVGANISSSTGIPTKVSELQNDSNFTTKTYVDDAVGNNATDLANYILSNDEALEELQTQIDGAIDTWYYAVDPTTSNEPAVNWTTTAQKDSHLRDLYFNTSNGHTFRWAKEGSQYKWIQIQDADAIKALADAAAAQTTANTKKRIFVTQPTPPYDIGDLWTQGSSGDIKKCKVAKTSAQSYAASDWELASKYTDDSNLNLFKTEVGNTYATKVEVTQTEESLSAEISSAESSAKTYTDGKISQEVTDRNAAIQASADSITSTVSSTYATKTSVPTKVSQLTNDSNYATTTQAQGYANTAESNAVSTAAADATSKANAAEANAKADTTTKLANYYTKTQTDSAITQKADEISLSVAQDIYQSAQPNLTPYFSRLPYETTDYWLNDWTSGFTYSYLDDGWVHVQCDNSDGSSIISCDPTPARSDSIKEGENYTFLLEFRNNNSSGTATGTDVYVAQRDNAQFWGTNITKNLEGAGDNSTVNIINDVPANSSSVYTKRFTKLSEAAGSSHWTGDVTKLASITQRCAAGGIIDYEMRVSIYEGEYLGPYKPYSGKTLYSTQEDIDDAIESLENYADSKMSEVRSELEVTTSGITTEVSKKVGYDEIISTINQSAEAVTIQANKIDIAALSEQITLLASNILFGNKSVADNLTELNAAVSIDTQTSTIYVGDRKGFHVRIDGSQLGFYQAGEPDPVAYINNNQLYITQSVVLQQMDIGTSKMNDGDGQWSWKIHKNSNGENNLYLKWMG